MGHSSETPKVFPNFGLGVLPQLALFGPFDVPSMESFIRPKIWLFSASKAVSNLPVNNESRFFFSLPMMKYWGQTKDDGNELVKNGGREKEKEKIRIGIIGGGMCGNSVAYSLAQNLSKNEKMKKEYDIVVLEGDPHSAVTTSLTTIGEPQLESPKWHAAVARNANSIVPGSAMHVFSCRSVLLQVITDTIREWYVLKKEFFYSHLFPKTLMVRQHDDFDFTPPYFALHPWRCLGPAASSAERWSFVRYLRHYLYTTIMLGEAEASRRGHYMCQLAKANRDIFLEQAHELNKKGHNIKYTRGFIGLYRNLELAQHSMEETLEHGEEARLLEWDEAIKKEPKLQNLPVTPLYAVHRPNEVISSCEEFMRALTEETRSLGVTFRGLSTVQNVEMFKKDKGKGNNVGYRVRCKDGAEHEFDLVVLAAGIETPILAGQLKAERFVPTYPLRGFSLTNFVKPPENKNEEPKENLLKISGFSFDAMYCTSVSPYMARFAGFGEFAGYPGKDDDVSSIAPTVMSRYSRMMFPQGVNGDSDAALRCYRATSPDDLPLVGAIPTLPGLFVHTGHGK